MSSQSASNPFGQRRRSREMALQLLFQREFVTPGHGPTPEAAARRFIQDFTIEPEVSEYGTQLFLGVNARVRDIDAVIQSHSSHWKIPRMGLVDVSVMRIAIFEMKFLEPAMTPNIAIDEAVELAKKFGSTDSGSFVNGILDQVARRLKD
jgi:transcription antitermination protein NusB